MDQPSYRREAVSEVRVYWPALGKHPDEHCGRFVGKPVSVYWLPPISILLGATPKGESLYGLIWKAWVPALGRLIPECDFKPQFKGD